MKRNNAILFGIAISIVGMLINALFVMLIWNRVLVEKIKGADLQSLSYGDAIAVSVFICALSCGVRVLRF